MWALFNVSIFCFLCKMQSQIWSAVFKFVLVIVVIFYCLQVGQPQVCYPNPKQDTLDLKSSMCRKVSRAAKKFLSLRSLQRICLNQSVLSAPLPPPLKPFSFTGIKVHSSSKTTSKSSMTKILISISHNFGCLVSLISLLGHDFSSQ